MKIAAEITMICLNTYGWQVKTDMLKNNGGTILRYMFIFAAFAHKMRVRDLEEFTERTHKYFSAMKNMTT